MPAWGRLRWQTVQTVGGTTVGETVTTKVKTTSVACQWPGSGLMLLDEAVAAQAQMRSRARVSAARRALPRRAVVSAGVGSAGWAYLAGCDGLGRSVTKARLRAALGVAGNCRLAASSNDVRSQGRDA